MATVVEFYTFIGEDSTLFLLFSAISLPYLNQQTAVLKHENQTYAGKTESFYCSLKNYFCLITRIKWASKLQVGKCFSVFPQDLLKNVTTRLKSSIFIGRYRDLIGYQHLPGRCRYLFIIDPCLNPNENYCQRTIHGPRCNALYNNYTTSTPVTRYILYI